jgi:CDP-diacylglycerol--glycerol-3-phosphate 3-phosphatidyltransferase
VGVHLIAVVAIYWMTVVSILSAVDYFVGFWKKIDRVSGKRRRLVLSRKKRVAEAVKQ